MNTDNAADMATNAMLNSDGHAADNATDAPAPPAGSDRTRYGLDGIC